MSYSERIKLALLLAFPSMLAQLSNIVMEYIDASMVGSLGAQASASIGLVSTTIWLMGGTCHAFSSGFTVQVAHFIGAKDDESARAVLRHGVASMLVLSAVLGAIGVAISGYLPTWLGGGDDIKHDATMYFMIYSCCLPLVAMNAVASGMLRCSGNVQVPSVTNIVMCLLDVIFNFIFIFPSHTFTLFGHEITIWGAGLGVVGAAVGTALAIICCVTFLLWYLFFKSDHLNIHLGKGSFRPTKSTLHRALSIGSPLALERVAVSGAQIATTVIIAPLGTVAIAAHAFGIIIESICYMPGYGISDSATTLIGQTLGAKRSELANSFAKITVGLGIATMTFMGIIMYITVPFVAGIMTPDVEVQSLIVQILRIEAFAEPMFAASIVCYGVFVGAGDTLTPSLMNLSSMWIVRITLAYILSQSMGLTGVWTAMAIELTFRGIIFLIRLWSGRWKKAMPIK